MIELNEDNFVITDNEIIIDLPHLTEKEKKELTDLIVDNIRIRRELEYRANNPMAFNYAQFSHWVSELLVPKTTEEKRIWMLKQINNE